MTVNTTDLVAGIFRPISWNLRASHSIQAAVARQPKGTNEAQADSRLGRER